MKMFVYRFARLGIMSLLVGFLWVCLASKDASAIAESYPSPPQNQVTAAPGTPQDTDILGKIASKYQQKAEVWASGLTAFAERLFKAFLIIDIVMFAYNTGLGIATGSKNIATLFSEFTLFVIIPAGFMYSVLHYYQTWSHEIINGLYYVASSVEPASADGASGFFKAGISLFDNIYETIQRDSPSTWGLIIVGIILVICYAMMAMRILMIKCESYIVLNAGIIILGLGAFNQTRSYAINFIRYVLAVAIKLYVMQLMIGIMFSFVDDFLKTPIDMANLTVVMGASIVMLGLIHSIPEMCASIISGSAGSSGSTLGGALSAVGGAAMGAGAAVAGAAAGAMGVPAAVKAAAGAADAAGMSGLGKAASMAGMLGKAAGGAMLGDAGERSFTGRFASKLSSRAMDSSMKNDGGNA